ncbi:tetraspanin-8-like [Pholidichthys leucotaenia]
MTQINTCLKRTFTVFNIIFAIIGGLIIALALLCQFYMNFEEGSQFENRFIGLLFLYVVGIITLVIASFGAYGAHKESKVALIVFLVCMVIGSLIMLRAGIVIAIGRSQIDSVLDEALQKNLPLDPSSQGSQFAEALQRNLHCCGLFSYKDWTSIPDSCVCDSDEIRMGLCQTIDYTMLMDKRFIYSKPCRPILLSYAHMAIDVMIGIAFTLASLALIGLVLSSLMIHQLRYPNRPVVMLTAPTIFAPAAPPKYQELHNPPEY